jgi:translation initiation factor 4A
MTSNELTPNTTTPSSDGESKTQTLNYSIEEWDDVNLNLDSNILRGIFAYGFEQPSPIQKKALYPMTMKGKNGKRRDIIAQAQSGTGKTGCFTVGVLNNIDFSRAETQALILAPTHELARQICDVLENIGKFCKIQTQLLVGGTSVDSDRQKLDKTPPHVVVGTPGRVHDMIRRKYLKTNKMSVIVCDEADEMLSQGFKDQIYKIFQYMPGDIQVGLFSATVPEELSELTEKFMDKPIRILVKAAQLTLQGIAQYYIKLDDDEQKFNTIKDLFAGMNVSQAIIYCNSTRRVDDLHEAMEAENYPVKKIHGKMEASERKEVNKDFRDGGCRVLITSDLYARGIDVQQVSIVINFDVPKSEHTYLHRIGRSGRWGRKGIAINFLTKHDGARIKHFEEYYNTQIEEMPADWSNHLKNI